MLRAFIFWLLSSSSLSLTGYARLAHQSGTIIQPKLPYPHGGLAKQQNKERVSNVRLEDALNYFSTRMNEWLNIIMIGWLIRKEIHARAKHIILFIFIRRWLVHSFMLVGTVHPDSSTDPIWQTTQPKSGWFRQHALTFLICFASWCLMKFLSRMDVFPVVVDCVMVYCDVSGLGALYLTRCNHQYHCIGPIDHCYRCTHRPCVYLCY